MKPMAASWLQKTLSALRRSLQLRLVLVFLLLALAVAATFITGAQKAFSIGWREAARPLVSDYLDRLAADITPDVASAPSVERALALTQRLPITVTIAGPRVNWQSHPDDEHADWHDGRSSQGMQHRDKDWQHWLQRSTADGHTLTFGINKDSFERRPRLIGYTLGVLLLLTLLAFLYVRRLLRPLDAIRAGAKRFGAGNFAQAIPVRHPARPDELGELAQAINTMGQDIHQMLEAKRALLLAISHELRSPLTRARLNTELLPETPEVQASREALLRDLALMRDLVTDLLESERLASGHTALNREPTDVAQLAAEVVGSLQGAPGMAVIDQKISAELSKLPLPMLDRTRLRLLLRNLLDNALRHSANAAQPPCLTIHRLSDAAGTEGTEGSKGQSVLQITVRDFGSGVAAQALPHLAEPFYRPDSARARDDGGVGLGLYLCKLVALAHGGTFTLRNAQPGLEVRVNIPEQPRP
jgi:signal transduction histidine kinase